MEKKRFIIKSDVDEQAFSNKRILYLVAIIVISFNLRPAITSVGPLLGTIRDQIGLENWSAGMITSLPLITFATVSPLAPRFGRQLGNERAVLLGLILLLSGIGMRSIPYTPTLFIGTSIIGIGIAVMNVLLPAVIKEKFPDKVGRMTSVYSTSMVILAAIASGLSVPLAKSVGLGWELALLSWAALAIFGIVVWIFAIRQNHTVKEGSVELSNKPFNDSNLWKSPLAWQVTLFMGLQSFIFYVMVSWLPEIMQSFGFSVSAAGWMIAYVQFVGLPSTFLAPVLAEKFSNQQSIVLGIGGGALIGFIGLLIGGPLPLIFVWVTLIGVTFGGAISLSLVMLSMRARNGQEAGALSGMAQSVGYIFAAVGPLLIGVLYDITHAWAAPFIAIIIVCFLMILVGVSAGRNKYV